MALVAHPLFYTAIALWLLTDVGNRACRLLFKATGLEVAKAGAAANAQPAGYIIGGLERLIIATGILAQSWEILGAVIALKTVARFKELDDRMPAEYFLIGSLFSLAWAMLITGAWQVHDARIGAGVHRAASQLLRAEAPITDAVTVPVLLAPPCEPWCPLSPLVPTRPD